MHQVFRTIVILLFSTVCSVAHGQDSLNMRKMANLDGLGTDYNDVWGYIWGDKEYAIVGSDQAINIVDVTDCSTPILVSQWIDGGNKIWRDFKDYKGYVYGVCDSCNEGLQVISKNNPVDSFWQYTSEFARSHNIFIDVEHGRLYAAGTNTLSRGLWVYDLTKTPQNPELLAGIDFQDWDGVAGGVNWYVHDVYVRDNIAYCSHGNRGHAAWDMSDLSNIIKLGEFNDDGYNHSSWVHDSEPYEYVAREVPNGMDMQVYDITDYNNIDIEAVFSHTIHTPTTSVLKSTPHNPYFHLDKLFVSNYHDGLKVWDLELPDQPEILAYYDTYDVNNGNYNGYEGCWGTYPYLPSGCILASDISTGLYTFKLLVEPTSDVNIDNAALVLSQPGGGIYFSTKDSKLWKLKVSDSGLLQKSLESSLPTDALEIVNSNLLLSSNNSELYMRSLGGTYYLIKLDAMGNIEPPVAVLASEIPPMSILVEDENIFLSQYDAGLKMTTGDGVCYTIKVITGGATQIELCD